MVRGCTTQCTAPPTLVALLVNQHLYAFDASMLRITYMCPCVASPATCLSSLFFDLITADAFTIVPASRSAQQKVPLVLGLPSYDAPLYTPMRLTTLARKMGKWSIPWRCCGTRDFLSLSRTPSSSCWTKATIPDTLPRLLPLSAFPLVTFTPLFLSGTQRPRLLSGLVLPVLGLLNKLFTAQHRGPGRDKRRKWSPGEHVVYCKVQEGCCSSIDPRWKICGTSAASVSCVGRGNTSENCSDK
ncbi:hypothetical protein GE21DRAFT_1060335 [Neurospora crassa]|nr:hypothetical protein GE21DRAFT_1060335 [Neurospora crassa]